MKSTISYHSGGGGNPYRFLRQYRKKALYSLITSFKRYYLDIWLIKLPFYAIFSESKAKKWREKKAIRYTNLQNAKKQFFAFRKLIPQSKVWLDSPEFKEKYTNHPYPPLLNPDSIDYESISADLAWEMNLPLPPHYDIINISNGLSASAATLYFLKQCNINVPDGNFMEMYAQLLRQNPSQKTAIFFYWTAFCCDKTNAMRFKYMLHKKVPLLYIARDPISKIKSLLNHITYRAPHCTRFNLTCNPRDLVPQETYMWSGDIKPSFKILENPTHFEQESKCKHLTSYLTSHHRFALPFATFPAICVT